MVERELTPRHRCTIAIVGKYIELHDAYLSIAEALNHAARPTAARVGIAWIDAESVRDSMRTSSLRSATEYWFQEDSGKGDWKESRGRKIR